jgi:hypothetical protein
MVKLRPFFSSYMNAYLALDAAGFSPFYHYPALISDAEGDHVIRDADDIEAYERPFIATLRDAGLKAIEFEILKAQELGGSECTCTNRYAIMAENARLIGDMEYHYFLMRDGEQWRIKFARIGQIHAWQEDGSA